MPQLRGIAGALLLAACFHDGGVVSSTASTASTTDAGASATTTLPTSTSEASTTTTTTTAASATDDVSVGTTLRPPADLAVADLGAPEPACPDDPDLVACYPFDDGWADELLVDAVGEHHGSLVGATPTAGVRGLAALTQPTSAIAVPAAIAPAGGAPWTVTAWVRLDVLPSPTRAGIVDRDFDYGVFIAAAGNVQCGNLMGKRVLQPGVWAHIACVWYADHREIYVDGVLDVSLADVIGRPPAGRPLVLANNSPPSADEALVGALDEVMLFRRSLGAAELCAVAGIPCDRPMP